MMEGYEVYRPDSHGPDISLVVINLLDHYRDLEAKMTKDKNLPRGDYFKGMRALGDIFEGLHSIDKDELKLALADLGEISKEYKLILDKAVALYKRNLTSLLNLGGKLRECEKQVRELELKCS